MTNNTTAVLTDEKIVEIYDDFYTQEDERESSHILPFARAIERALLTSPRAAVPAPDLYWFGDHEHGFECPDDAAIVHGRKLGERFTLKASWYADMLFEVTKVPDDNDDDYEVREVDAAPAAPVADAAPTPVRGRLISSGPFASRAVAPVAADHSPGATKMVAAQAVAADGAACKGKNCGATDGVSHSPECLAEHEAAVTGAVAADGEATDQGSALGECVRVLESCRLLCNWPDMRTAIDGAIKLGRAAVSPAPAQDVPASCPHAGPHHYCATCAVSPCPIGLGGKK